MVTLPIRYPLDKTGVNPDNKVEGEIHTLLNRTVRAVAPLYGAFYAESLVITDLTTNLQLTTAQYTATEMLEFPTGAYGKEICGIILIKDQSVSNNISITYQALGGSYTANLDAIVSLLNSVELDNRPVAWPDIINKPPGFEPASHYHDIGDIYGFEYVVHALERVRRAILIGDAASHDEIMRYIDRAIQVLTDRLALDEQNLASHKADFNNPHNTTKAQVGLSLVDNYQTANQLEAEQGVLNTRFMTPQRTREAIAVQAGQLIQNHVDDQSNPHGTTKAQVGLGLVDNFATATSLEATNGTAPDKFMTPLRVREAIDTRVGNALTNHINDAGNPHATTKGQVGLGLVENYPVANQAEAEAGAAVDRYMTPQRVRQAITAQAGALLATHVQDTNNPHQTTKAQVGLGSVENNPTATQQEAQEGTSNVRFMTPLRTAQLIDVRAVAPLNAHAGRVDNPHQVSKGQVGLGNVSNFLTANDSEATAANVGDRFMTPYGVRLAIGNLVPGYVNAHAGRTDNPHQTTKAQVGLSNVENFGLSSYADAVGGASHGSYMTPVRVRDAINAHAASGDHDSRYIRYNADASCALREVGGQLHAFIAGAWRVVWPPQWQG